MLGPTDTESPQALCHCGDCHKISGSTYSTNVAVEDGTFKVDGSPKQYAKTADGGNKIVSHFCGECGSTLYRTGDSFPGLVIVKAGCLDDSDKFQYAKPDLELYAPQRPVWVSQVSGTQDQTGMPSG